MSEKYAYYPSSAEVDAWIDELFSAAGCSPVRAEIIDPELFEWPNSNNLPYQYAARHHRGAAYVRCTPETVESLYNELKCTRSLTYIMEREHSYTPEFLYLCGAWFRMYA
jgi:hypothetical protein